MLTVQANKITKRKKALSSIPNIKQRYIQIYKAVAYMQRWWRWWHETAKQPEEEKSEEEMMRSHHEYFKWSYNMIFRQAYSQCQAIRKPTNRYTYVRTRTAINKMVHLWEFSCFLLLSHSIGTRRFSLVCCDGQQQKNDENNNKNRINLINVHWMC